MKLLHVIKYQGIIKLQTGLAIKGQNNDINIGGADSEVIKNPITGMPYIPGSSLKGKMRSLLELKKGVEETNRRGNNFGAPCGCGRKSCMVCTIFGAHKNPKAESAPTRIIVRDASLTEESLNTIQNMPLESGSFLEVKAENSINRNRGTAESPRFIERVPAGLSFDVEILLQIFEGDDENVLKETVDEAIRLLENSYLGGSGSRGYGQVKFEGSWMKI